MNREDSEKNYEKQREIFLGEGYIENEEIISIKKANVMAIVLSLPIIILFGFMYMLKWDELKFEFSSEIILYCLLLIISIPIHELLHGLGWGIFCKKGFKSVRFGIMKPSFTPYCNCMEPLNFMGYIFGGSLPLILLGIIPSIIGILIGNIGLWILGSFGILAAGGDMTIMLSLFKYKNGIFLDHPSECGFIVFTK